MQISGCACIEVGEGGRGSQNDQCMLLLLFVQSGNKELWQKGLRRVIKTSFFDCAKFLSYIGHQQVGSGQEDRST